MTDTPLPRPAALQQPPSGDQAWLARQEAQRRGRANRLAAAQARQDALTREYLEETARTAARVRARTCPTCFLVRTPAGTCNCTDD